MLYQLNGRNIALVEYKESTVNTLLEIGYCAYADF